MSAESGFRYRPAIDGLRALAVLAVVFYHLDYGWARGGFLGVDTFFVLSGYLITSLLLVERASTGGISLRAFWARRARRLLPAVGVLLAAVCAYSALWARPDRLDTIRGDALATVFYVANWRFVLTGTSYFDLLAEPSPLRHMWSLAIEEQFYLLFPLAVAGLLAARRSRLAMLVAVLAAGIGASALMMRITHDVVDPSRSYFGTDTRVHQLLVGAMLAVVLFRFPRLIQPVRGVAVAGVVALLVVLWAFATVHDEGSAYYEYGALAFGVVVAVLVAAASAESGVVVRVFSLRPLVALGMISYGVYLWHWPLIIWLTRDRIHVDGPAADAVRVAATIGAATLSYYLVERPVRYRAAVGRGFVRVLPATAVGLAGLVLLSTAGGTTNFFEEDAGQVSAVAVPAEYGPGNRTLLLVGDSTAKSMLPGLTAVFSQHGWDVVGRVSPGCPVTASLLVRDEHGNPREHWSEDCAAAMPAAQRAAVGEYSPDVVLWSSQWESVGFRLASDGRFVPFGSAESDELLLDAMDDAFGRLARSGAKIVVLRPIPWVDARADDERTLAFEHLWTLYQRFAAAHTSVELLDTTDLVCPGGPPCPLVVDGISLRPDRIHFDETSSLWYAKRLLPMLDGAAA